MLCNEEALARRSDGRTASCTPARRFAGPSLRNKKDLIESFVDSLTTNGDVDEEWREFIGARRREEFEAIIEDEMLRPEETEAFMQAAFLNGAIQTSGTAITGVLPATSRFSADGGHGEKKQRVIARLDAFFERFFGLSSGR